MSPVSTRPAPRRRLRVLTAVAAALACAWVLLAPSAYAQEADSVTEEGYVEMSDGVGLRYTVIRPEGPGPFPVLVQYNGYAAGTNPYDNGMQAFGTRMLDQGFAILGVNMRGTGCSEGRFDLFTPLWSSDGAAVVEWVAEQPWSNGRVGMIGGSFSGISQLMVASQQPPSLAAIAPSVTITDLYRDVGYPGGMYNQTFADFWTFTQKIGYADVPGETAAGDARCAAAVAEHNDPDNIIAVQGPQHPYADDELYERFMPPEAVDAIDVPALLQSSWQDEQLGSRVTEQWRNLDAEQTWVVNGNGNHNLGVASPLYNDLMERFFRHYLLDDDNGWTDTPHTHLLHEVDLAYEPGWTTTPASNGPVRASYPPRTRDVTLHFQPDGSLAIAPPAGEPAAFDYPYPLPAPSVHTTVCGACRLTLGEEALEISESSVSYKTPVPDEGSVSFTTPALASDVEMFGPASLDVWLSSTAESTDLQVTLTEVRPDGNEQYVQRGWLRASHRELDEDRSTATRPFHTHAEADVAPLVPGEPTAMRVEVWPVNHVFRAGSAMRVYVEAPVGFTGFRQLEYDPTPATNSVHVGAAMPSRLVFSVVPGGRAATGLPACDSLINQPCRPDPGTVPPGSLEIPPEQGSGQEPDREPGQEPGSGQDEAAPGQDRSSPQSALPATGGGAAGALGLTGLVAAGLLACGLLGATASGRNGRCSTSRSRRI